MKLTCDLCGGELQMNPGGQGATCANCGLTYPIEQLKEKLGLSAAPTQSDPQPSVPDTEEVVYDVIDWTPLASNERQSLHISTYVRDDFSAAVIIDEQHRAVIRGKCYTPSCSSVTGGEHTVFLRVTFKNDSYETEPIPFFVNGKDWHGEIRRTGPSGKLCLVLAEESEGEPAEPRMHNFYLARKFNLSGCLAKAGIYLDGEQCAILGAKGEACVPISEGPHEVVVRIASGVGLTEMEKVTFQVKDRDVVGLLYLKQGAFTASWVFEVREKIE